MQMRVSLECHLALNVRHVSKRSASFPCCHVDVGGEKKGELSGALSPLSHPLFLLISLENLVKIGRCSKAMGPPPAAGIPHCFHSCRACRTRLKAEGGRCRPTRAQKTGN